MDWCDSCGYWCGPDDNHAHDCEAEGVKRAPTPDGPTRAQLAAANAVLQSHVTRLANYISNNCSSHHHRTKHRDFACVQCGTDECNVAGFVCGFHLALALLKRIEKTGTTVLVELV